MSHHVFRVALLPRGVEVCTPSSSNHQTTTLPCRRWDINHFPIKIYRTGIPGRPNFWRSLAPLGSSCTRMHPGVVVVVVSVEPGVISLSTNWNMRRAVTKQATLVLFSRSLPEDDDVDGGGILPLKSRCDGKWNEVLVFNHGIVTNFKELSFINYNFDSS